MSFPLASYISIANSTSHRNLLLPKLPHRSSQWSTMPDHNTSPAGELTNINNSDALCTMGVKGTMNGDQIIVRDKGNSFTRIARFRGVIGLHTINWAGYLLRPSTELLRLPQSSRSRLRKPTINFPNTPEGELRIILNKVSEVGRYPGISRQWLHEEQSYQAPVVVFRRLEQVQMNVDAKRRRISEGESEPQYSKRRKGVYDASKVRWWSHAG
jgi:hypothetical protein